MKKGGTITTIVVSECGKTVKRTVYPFRSFTANCMISMAVRAGRLGTTAAVNIDGGNTNMTSMNPSYTYASVNNVAKGIRIGASNAAFNIDQYNLQDPLVNTSDISYSESEAILDNTTGYGVFYAQVGRSFKNLTGSPITVRECGIVANPSSTTTNTGLGWLFTRDIIDETVPPNHILFIQYRLHPASDISVYNNWAWMHGLVTIGSFHLVRRAGLTQTGARTTTGVYDLPEYGIDVGLSDAAFDPSDYDLDDTDTELTRGSNNVALDIDDASRFGYTLSRTFVNNTASPITIREVADFMGGTSYSQWNWYMTKRVVLDPPVTIQPSEGHTFIFEEYIDK